MADVNAQTVAAAMYALIKENHGKKNLKATDLTKAMIEKFGDACDKTMCKAAIREIVENGTCTYSYVGGSFIVLNPDYKG
jgi:hypothetical protein